MKTVCRVTTGQVHFLIIAFTYIHIQEPPGTIRSKIRKSVTFLFYLILLLFLFHRILQFHRYFVLYMYTVVQSEVSGISGGLAMPQRIWRHTGRTLRSITQLRGFCLIFLAPGR